MQRDTPGVIAPPPLIYLAALGLGLGLHAVFPVPVLPVPVARTVGVLLMACAAVIFALAFRAMARARTSVRPDRPTTALVTSGPFGYTRNPLYVALTLTYLGIALAVNALAVLLLIVPALVVLQRGVVAREERYLERKFGDAYVRYKTRVRRWL